MNISEGKITITLLVDNIATEGLTCEHGLSFLIQTPVETIVFDTGQGDALFTNAQKLGVDPACAEIMVISHGHYDHTGAVADFLRLNPHMKVYCHPDVTIPRFSRHPGKAVRDIAMPPSSREALSHHPSNLRFLVTRPCRIADRIHISGEIPRLMPFEDTGGPFFLDAEGTTPDMILDDQSLWLETAGGLLIVLGCCHSGLLNTVEYIRKASGVERVRGIIGGMHLLNASAERLERTLEKLREWSPEFVIPCHCTGGAAIELMQSQLGQIVKPGYAGMKIAI